MNRYTLAAVDRTVATVVVVAIPFVVVGETAAGLAGSVAGLGIAAVLVALAWFGCKPILLRASHAAEVDRASNRELVELVERLAQDAGIRTPAVAVSSLRTPNAFAAATPGSGMIGTTTAALELLSPTELEALLAHEITQLKRPGHAIATVAAVFASVPGAIAAAAGSDLLYEHPFTRAQHRRWGGRCLRPLRNGLALANMLLVALIVRCSISRDAQLDADLKTDRLDSQRSALTSALRKIDALAGRIAVPVNPAVSHLLVIHPYGPSRLARLFDARPPLTERLNAIATSGHLGRTVAPVPSKP